MKKEELANIFDSNQERFIEEWKKLLMFPSISADPGHNSDCMDCANWLVDHLSEMGFSSKLMETSSKPVVFAERKGKLEKPVILFYGHYDVQPVDPLENWTTPPFEPVLKDERLYARGAQDNKGQLFFVLKALESLIKNDLLNCTVKIIIEGEEECGSRGISEGLDKWSDFIQADVLMVSDTNAINANIPAIVMGLRGIIYLSLSLTGPLNDLHSGVHGGVAPNPAIELSRLITSLYNSDGSIAVEGFYDSVKPPSERERILANAIPFNMESYKSDTGVPAVAGEKDFTPTERTGFRPSIDVNGIHSGYGGSGIKTIIPNRAIAKITARIVPGQDPESSLSLIINHLKKHTPEGLHLEITEKGIGGAGFHLDSESSISKIAEEVLLQVTGNKPSFLWEGASIPIVSSLMRVSNAEPLLVGFGREEDNIHAPDESFSLKQFKTGYLYAGLMFITMQDYSMIQAT